MPAYPMRHRPSGVRLMGFIIPLPPGARFPGGSLLLITAVRAVRALRDPVALALLPESFAGQAEQLCSFGLVVPRPLQRLENVLLLELLAGGVQSVHQHPSLVRHGHPFAAKSARRLRRAAEIRARREPAEVPGLDLTALMAQRHSPVPPVFPFSDVAGEGIAQKQ